MLEARPQIITLLLGGAWLAADDPTCAPEQLRHKRCMSRPAPEQLRRGKRNTQMPARRRGEKSLGVVAVVATSACDPRTRRSVKHRHNERLLPRGAPTNRPRTDLRPVTGDLRTDPELPHDVATIQRAPAELVSPCASGPRQPGRATGAKPSLRPPSSQRLRAPRIAYECLHGMVPALHTSAIVCGLVVALLRASQHAMQNRTYASKAQPATGSTDDHIQPLLPRAATIHLAELRTHL